MRRDGYDLDSAISSIEEQEERMRRMRSGEGGKARVQVGTVEQYFDRLGVVAIKLSGRLAVGQIIEIGTEDEAVRQRVASMQIDREDVQEASEGDSVGVRLRYEVAVGSGVYLIE